MLFKICHFLLLSAIILHSIFCVNSTKIERFWTAFPENKANQIVIQINTGFTAESRELKFYFYVNKSKELFGQKYIFNGEYENEEKLRLWNGEVKNIASGNLFEINLNSKRGFTIKLDDIGISDIGNFEVKIAAEYKEMIRTNYYRQPNFVRSTGRVKRQLFKLVKNAEHFAILDDFPAEGETEASSSSSLHSNRPEIVSTKEKELLNWMPNELRQIIAQNKQLAEQRANLLGAKYFNFAYVGEFEPKKALAQSAASFFQFFIYVKEAEGFFTENMQIRICKRGDWNSLTKDCGLQVHWAQFVPSEVKYLAKCGIRLERGENKNVHLYIILEGGKNEYGIKEVLELKTDSLGDNVLMLERPNAESQWKPSSSAPGTSSNAADSILVSSLTVKHFFIEDLLIFEYIFEHDEIVRGGYGASYRIHHKRIEYCSEEKWNPISQNCEGGNGQQVEIMNKKDETKSTYRLSAEQIQLSLLNEAIRIFVQIKTSARPNAVQVLEVDFSRRENKIKISQVGAEGGVCQILQ